MDLKDLYYRKLPRARFRIWLETTLGLNRSSLKTDWWHIAPDEKLRITEMLVKRYGVHVTHTRDKPTDEWFNSACVCSSIVRFSILGEPIGHGLDEAEYKTSWGSIYKHIDNPLGLPCHLVNTCGDGSGNINHMVNAMQIGEDAQRLTSWAFFDGAGIMKSGNGMLTGKALIISRFPYDVRVYHSSVDTLKQQYIAQFEL